MKFLNPNDWVAFQKGTTFELSPQQALSVHVVLSKPGCITVIDQDGEAKPLSYGTEHKFGLPSGTWMISADQAGCILHPGDTLVQCVGTPFTNAEKVPYSPAEAAVTLALRRLNRELAAAEKSRKAADKEWRLAREKAGLQPPAPVEEPEPVPEPADPAPEPTE